ncbi:unnamed protein product [Paramecium pentaurelia]|uniref:Polycystin cation channel PKD1/PKD2 domain-containing protein n=1 Tax=Paramecium pentaurelia TaxID=43138 RepID=A0A8S1UA04_9CILI|nr:unnamed protein product [Paramecium pentaurelia]
MSTPPSTNNVIITKVEIARFTIYLVSLMVSVLMQMRMEDQGTMNTSVQNSMFSGIQNVFKFTNQTRFSMLNWVDKQLYHGYSLNQNSTEMYSRLIPATFLEIQTKYAKIDSLVNVWDKDLTEDKANQGFQQQYIYPFIQRFPPYPVFKNISFIDDVSGITLDSLKLIDTGYLTSNTHSLKAQASYYSPNLQMICVVRINMEFSAAGQSYQFIQYDSFRLSFYQNKTDYIRMAFEIVFAIIYINYLYMEGYKIYFKIQLALKDDDLKVQAQKKKDQRMKSKKDAKKRGGVVQGEEGEVKHLAVQGEKSESKGLEKIEEARRKTKIIINVVIQHISDIWSAIDVFILVILGIAASEYIKAISSQPYSDSLNELFQNATTYQSVFEPIYKQMRNGIQVPYTLNDEFAQQADVLRFYRRFCAVALLIMWIKLLKYFINIFKRLVSYLEIILNVIEYMIFYLVLLAAILISFSLFFYFQYGSQIFITSTIGRSLSYILGFMIAQNDQFNELFKYNEVITFIMTILYYVIVIIILCNMFFVFVKQEYNEYQMKLEKQSQKTNNSKKHDEVVKYIHPYWYFYNIAEYFVMRFWFTLKLQPSKFDEYNENKELLYVINEREFKENPQTIDFNVDFANLINQSVDDDDKNQKFLIEEEKERILSKQKMELIKLIWKTVLLLLILSLNFILLQEFYSPADAYLQSDSISRKIKFDRSNAQKQYKDLNTIQDMTDWLIYGFPDLFEDNIFGNNELAILKGQAPTIKVNASSTDKILNYQLQEYAFDNLIRTSSLNTFNIVVNDVIRVTIRRSLMVNNTIEQFSTFASETMLLFLDSPTDNLDSEFENYESFYDADTNFTIDYDDSNGFEGYGGLVMLLEPKQLSPVINSLQKVKLIDSVSSIAIQFVTFNPINARGLAHIKLSFAINQCGALSFKLIDVQGIKKNSLQSVSEISILILSVSLIIALCYYLYVTIKTMLHKNFSYDRWYSTYILLSLNRSQLYMRERHMPEFIRKSLFLMDISQLLNLLFLTLLGAQITLILYYFFQVNTLIQGSKIFGTSINDLLPSTLFSVNQNVDDYLFFSQVQNIGDNSKLIGAFGSCAILVLCLEILYLLSHNKDFQTLTNSIKYTLSHLPFILIILLGIIVAFSSMAHLVLGTDLIQYSTFFGTIVKMLDFISKIDDIQFFRLDDRTLEFYLMILPYTITVRFIIMNMFFAITLRGYLLSKEKQAEEQLNQKSHPLSLTSQEFVMLSIQMFTFKEKLIKVGSDQYLMQIIKQFQPIKVYSSIKDNIRNQTNLTAMKAWAEECAKEIKDEKEIRKPLDVACHELLQAYIDQNNKGEFDILQRLNTDPKRKLIEFSLKLTYINYFRFAIDQLDKFTVFFSKKREQIRSILFSDSKGEDYKKMVYICSLEAQLEENIQSMTFIKQELLALGFDIGEAGEIDSKENVIKVKQQKQKTMKATFQNPMSDKIFEITKLKPDKNQDIKNSPDQSDNEPDQDNQFGEQRVEKVTKPSTFKQAQTIEVKQDDKKKQENKDQQQGETTEKSTDEKPKSDQPPQPEQKISKAIVKNMFSVGDKKQKK